MEADGAEEGGTATTGTSTAKPTTRDVGISAERLSLMIEFHHRGSLTSLDRSYNSIRGSNFLKSNLDFNNRRRSTSSLFNKHPTPNLPRHDNLVKDKVRRQQ